MEPALDPQQSSLFIRPTEGAGGRVYWDSQWRYRHAEDESWTQKRFRLGQAWQEPDGAGGYRKRKGRCPEGYLDERAANVAAVAAMAAHADELAAQQRTRQAAANRKLTVRELAHEWIEWLAEVRGAKPSTVRDYTALLREPGIAFKRGDRVTAGRIMGALGDRPYEDVTSKEISAFLRDLDKQKLTPRNVNKHRQVLSAIFAYACRADSYGLSVNPVNGTDKRREAPPVALDYYEVHEVELLAETAEQGLHRPTGQGIASDETLARAWEDRRDADAFRVLFYTGMRVGELLALRVEDVDLGDRMVIVRRTLSAAEETLPKGGRSRWVPLSTPAHDALVRLLDREDFIASDDYVVVNRLGRRVDASALRRRYKQACEQAGLRPVKLHGLRHAAGSLVARTSDPVFVRDFLGHSKLSTTDRYVSAKLRPEEFERLDRAFGVEPAQIRNAGERHN
jgi:integrase